MTEDADRERAAELYAQARQLFEEERYWEARPLYEESLRLHEDAEVRAAYRTLMATIGPV
jgi:tetratricopeptide (TPR) repeat protein